MNEICFKMSLSCDFKLHQSRERRCEAGRQAWRLALLLRQVGRVAVIGVLSEVVNRLTAEIVDAHLV